LVQRKPSIHNTIKKITAEQALKDGLVDEICGPEDDIVMLAKTGYELRDKCPTLG
jgi:3-hydroxyacyl-CoA dehydrogenase/enoyl-CoA hydratase/3-hydroxybutyryl-CoA epimerase